MSNHDLKILISAELDTSQKAINNLNNQLKQIEGKLDKLNIGINNTFGTNANDFKLKIDTSDIDKAQKELKKLKNELNEVIKSSIKQLSSGDLNNRILTELRKHNARLPREGSPYHRELRQAMESSGYRLKVNKGQAIDKILPDIAKAVGNPNLSMEDIVNAISRGYKRYTYNDVKDDPVVKQLNEQVEKVKQQIEKLKSVSQSTNVFEQQQKQLAANINKTNEALQKQVDVINNLIKSIGKLGSKISSVGQVKQVQDSLMPIEQKIGNRLPDVQNHLFDRLNLSGLAGSNPNEYEKIFNSIASLSNKTALSVAKDIDKQISKYDMLGNLIDQVIQKQKEFTQSKTVTQNKVEGIARYSDLQQRVEEIKKSATDLSKITVDTKKDIKDIEKATISYKDSLGRLVQEKYKLIETDKKLDDNNGIQTIKEWELVSRKVTDNIEEQKKQQQSIQDVIAKTIKQREEENKLWDQNQAKAINKNLEEEYKNNLKINEAIQQRKEKLQSLLREVANKGYLSTNELREVGSGLFKSNSLEELDKYERKLDILIEKQKELKRQANLGVQVSKADSTLFNFGKQDDLKLFMSQFHDGEIKITKFKDGLQDGKNRLVEFNVQVQKGKKDVEEYKYYFDELTGAIYRNNAALKNNSNNQLGLAEQLGIAFERTFVWATAMTGFYGTIRSIQSMTQEILLVDNAMTELKRVMDATPEQYNDLLHESIGLSKELGANIHDLLKTMNGFARAGDYTKEQLIELTRVATIMSRISELTPDQAMENLLSIGTQFDMQIENYIDIANKLNEVDNRFATSTRDLSDALARSGSVAKEYNITLDEMLGYITSIQVATRASGAEVGNALKTIITRLNISETKEAITSAGIKISDWNNASEILNKVAQSWSTISEEQRQAIALSAAGRWQVSKFIALMNDFKIATEATKTSLSSQNSALIESAKAQDSLESRINRLKTAFTELSLAIGDAVLTDSFIGVVEGLKGLAEIGVKISNSFGVLPIVFGAIYTSVVLLNKNFKDFVTSTDGIRRVKENVVESFNNAISNTGNYLRTTKAEIVSTTVAMNTMQKATTSAKIAWRGLGDSVRGFLAATGVGLVFVAIGFALEKLISKITEYNEKQRQIKKEAEQLANTYTTNEDKIQSLADQYERLSNEVQKGLRPKDDEEYLKVQQELYNLIPTVASYVDQKGQAHLRSAEAVRKEIDSIKELSKLESNKFIDNFSNNIDKIKNKIDNLQNQINNIKNPVFDGGFTIPNYQPTSEEQIEIAIKQREINAAIEQAIGLYKQYADAYADTLGVKKQLNEEDKKYIETIIEENRAKLLTAKGQEEVTKKIKDYIGEVGNARKAVGDLFTGEEIRNFTDKQKSVIESIIQSLKNGYTDWDQYRKILGDVGFSADKVDQIINRLKGITDQQTNANVKAANSFEVLAGKINEAGEAVERKLTVSEKLLGISNSEIDAAMQAISTYQLLSQQENLSAEQSLMLADAKEYLANLYPHLVKGTELNIEAMRKEAEQNQVLLKAIDALKDGHLTAEQQMTLATALNAKSRLQILMQQAEMYERAAQRFAEMSDGTDENIVQAEKFYRRAQEKQASLREEIEAMMPDMDKWIQQLADATNYQGSVYKATDKDTESKRKNSKETEHSIYVADKYKQALEKVNTELEKINAIKSKFPQHSKEYQKALKQEIELLKQQKKIYENQAKDLQNQIKSGNIKQTGIINIKSTKASGNSTEATIWNFFASKGFSDSVIAGIMGNLKLESGLRTDAVNPSSGASGLAQWLGSRLTGLKKYADSLGKSWKDLNVQLEYMWKELNSTEKNTLNWLMSNQNADPATVAKMFNKLFERSGGTALSSRQKYANQYYKQFANGNVSRDTAETQQAIDEARSQLLQIQGKITNVNAEIVELHEQLVDSFVAEYEYAINYIQNKVKEYELKTQSLDESSEAYRSAINEQAYQLTMIDKKLNDEIWFLRQQATNNKNISQQKREELLSLAKEKEFERIENKLRIQDLLFEKVNSKLREYSDQIDDIDFKLERSQKLMSVYNEESDEYRKELEIQNKLLRQKQDLLHREAEYIREQLKSEKLSVKQKRELKERIEEISLAWVELENQIKSIQEKIADQVIDIFKKSYQKQKDFALEAIDKEMNALEKAHKKKMEMYDEDLSQFEEIVNKKIGLIDKQAEEENYNKELGKLQNEQLELQKRISILSLDDSSEAKAKRLELEKELATLTEQIEELKLGRERELRKENLEEVLETYRKEIEEKKEVEDEKYEIEKERLEKIRRETEFHYDNLINDEQYYANIRKNIMEGNFNEIKRIMQTFYDEMKAKNEEVTREMGESWAELTNLMNEITSGKQQISAIENTQISAIEDIQLIMDWQKYLENKRKYNLAKTPQEKQQLAAENTTLRRKYGFIDGSYEELSEIQFSNKDELRKIAWQEYLKNKQLYESTNSKEVKEKLKEENDALRAFWRFPDGSYNQLKNLKAYHEGGIVGQNDNLLTRTFRKLMDLKPNEQIVKALKGELMIPPLKIPNFISNIQSLSPTLANPSGNVANYYLTINIDQFTGTKKEADNLSVTIINNLKKMGRI